MSRATYKRISDEKARQQQQQKTESDNKTTNNLRKILDDIPKDPDEFYKDFGLLRHPRTLQPVNHLTAYQRRVWKEGQHYRYLLVVKSHRIGLSTSELLHDFWHAITDCRGNEILIVSQDLQHAKDHLYTLRKMILSSEKYRKFLISKPQEGVMRDEVTKVMQMFIRNPDNPFRPTRIIGLGTSVGGLWSWKDVKHIHMSDIAASKVDYADTIHSALTRLALTDGHIVIESPPMGIGNPLYDLYQKALETEREGTTDKGTIGQTAEAFRLIQIDATAAVDAGVMTQEFLDQQKKILGPQFDSYYGAKFTAVGGSVFAIEALERIQELGKWYKEYDYINPMTQKSLGIDVGWGSSDTAFVILERSSKHIRVLHTSSFSRASYSAMLDHAMYLIRKYAPNKTYVDGSAPEFVRGLKIATNELQEGETEEDYMNKISEWKKQGVDTDLMQDVIPINFSTSHKQMLAHLKYLVERQDTFAIHPDRFPELLGEMMTVKEKNGAIDKSRLQYDLFDALRLASLFFYVEPQQSEEGLTMS